MSVKDVNVVLPEIRNVLELKFAFLQRAARGNGDWTHGILDVFNQLPSQLSLKDLGKSIYVYPNTTSRDGAGEWLLGLIWWRMNGTNLKDIVLAVESEWSHYTWDVKYDFEKLLVVKSPIKILIAEDYHKDVMQMVEKELRAYEDGSDGETYMIALYANGKFNFTYYRKLSPAQLCKSIDLMDWQEVHV